MFQECSIYNWRDFEEFEILKGLSEDFKEFLIGQKNFQSTGFQRTVSDFRGCQSF